MINLQHSLETIDLPDENRAVIVDIPQINMMQHKKTIDSFLEENGYERNNIKSRHQSLSSSVPILVTWGEYLEDCVKVWQSYRKHGTVELKEKKMDYGSPYYDSLETYLRQVSDTMHMWMLEKLNDFKDKVLPNIDDLTPEKATQLVGNILKKKNMDVYVDSFRWTGLRSYITTLERELVKLQDENLLNTSCIKQLREQEKTSKSSKVKK